MRLSEIKPRPITSLLQRNRVGENMGMLVAGAMMFPALILKPNHQWAYLLAAIAAGAGTTLAIHHLQDRWRVRDSRTPPAEFSPPLTQAEIESQLPVWRELFRDSPVAAWVLFSYGTCVVSTEAEGDIVASAREVLRTYGPALPGARSGDMLVYPLEASGDYVIGGCHPNVLTFMSRSLIPNSVPADKSETFAAYRGRDRRVLDAFSLNPVHTEFTNASDGG